MLVVGEKAISLGSAAAGREAGNTSHFSIIDAEGGSRIISMVLLGVLEFARGNGPYV